MADTATPTKVEPTLPPTPPLPSARPGEELRAAAATTPVPAYPVVGAAEPASVLADRIGLDQLSRVEEKAARIEEKLARSEALVLRLETKVEGATARTEDAAKLMQEEVGTLASRMRRLPGFGALMAMGVVIAILTAAATVALLRYLPGMLPR